MGGRLQGRIAIVTGSAHGMGASHARCLAREGAHLALVDICRDTPLLSYGMGSGAEMHKVARGIESLGGKVMEITCDVSQADEVEKMVAAVIEKFGKVDILVNNAGVGLPALPLWEVTEAQWDRVLAVNLKGMFLCCKYVIPHMIRAKYGKIVNIGSTWGREGGAGAAPYSASKGGVHNLTLALAKDLAPYHINVNAVAPGLVQTPMQIAAEKSFAEATGKDVEELRNAFRKRISILDREITEEDVSNAVVFLCTEESRNIDGMVIYVDGGHAGP